MMTMTMTFYNTMTRRKEEFVPLDPPNVRMYCCGLTVYNYAHIGNLRTYIFEDVLRRALRFNGYALEHVQNVTDVGHMTTDADAGDDKMELAAKRENKSPWEIARFYEEAAIRDFKRLNIEIPERMPRATEHVVEMIALIQRLEANGYTYVTSEGVYFDTSKYPDYGKLARLRLEDQRQGAREEVIADETKKNPSDFVLWFLNKPTHIMLWESPWGPGYPGWHIECSAMSMKYLGETFDIHCGGVDHIPVHHTNEIAQSECATHRQFVRYWMHGEFLLTKTESDEKEGYGKESKSKGEFNTLQSLIDKGYDPLAYRYLCLQAHYRSELKFSTEILEAATAGLRRVYALCPNSDPLKDDAAAYARARERVLEAVNDDLAMPQAVGLLNSYGSYRLWVEFDSILGLDIARRSCQEEAALPAEVQALIEARDAARKARDWVRSDALRNDLIALGYEVGDGPQGTTVKKRAL
jgi:cysteinyl-tRNA synthetase